MVVSATSPRVPPPLASQLASGGRLVQPIGAGGGDQVTLFVNGEHGLVRCETVVPAHFVRLVSEYGHLR